MRQPVLVTGGTGMLGRLVVAGLSEAGQPVRTSSRRPAPEGRRPEEWATANLLTGAGVAEAVSGAGTVVHCATSGGRRSEVTATRTLVEAAGRAGCRHLLYVSIVGVDRVPFPYYRGKLAAEEIVAGSGVPYTILRATQFHDLLRAVFAWGARPPVMLVPDLPFQPVDVREVAARVVELATGDPAGRADDLGGPEVREATDLARGYLATTRRRRAVLPVRLPGRIFRAYRQGGHLAPDHATGRTTFEQYLVSHPDPARLSYRGSR